MFKKIFLNIKNFFLIIKNINEINKVKPKFIFYSENKSYLKYAYLLIESISKKYPGEIYYVSSDIEDKITNIDVKNMFIGRGILMQYFFLSVKGKNMFLTLTDLDNSIVKKNKYIENYIYFFHAAVSSTKIYTETAFDNYDQIFCNGDYHVKEIRKREELANLNKKKLIKSGYFYFDYLEQKINKNDICNEILVAPSWNKAKKNFINENFETIIDKLIKEGFKVRFRPHPENLKRSMKILNHFKEKFKGDNFIFDNEPENLIALEKSKCLMTDTSGIAIEYLLLMKRPILYFEDLDKIHNVQFDMFKDLETMDSKVKSKFGYKFDKNQIDDLKEKINFAISDFKDKDKSIVDFIEENFYNYNKTINYFDKEILKDL